MELKYEYCGTLRFALKFGLKISFKETVRLILRQLRCLAFNKILICRADGRIAGYGAVIKRSAKYSFAEKGSYILGPYWVSASFRKQGIGYNLVKKLTEDLSGADIYAYICRTNTPSLTVMQKAGYEIIGRMKETDGKYVLLPFDDESDLVVVKHGKKDI